MTDPTQNLIFRDAEASDIREILDLIINGVPPGAPPRIEDAPLENYKAAFTAITEDPNHRLIVGELGGQVVATMQMIVIPTLPNGGMTRMELESVHVSPEFRGGGIGRKLLDLAVEYAREKNAGVIQLTSNKSRKDAHRFYERFGFAQSHEGFKLYL